MLHTEKPPKEAKLLEDRYGNNFTKRTTQVRIGLTGPASQVALTSSPEVTGSWQRLKVVLFQRFVPPYQTERYECDFKNRNIKAGESFEDYAGALKMLLLRWKPHPPLEEGERLLVNQFCLGMNKPNTALAIKQAQHITFDEAVALASKSKSFEQELSGRSAKPAPGVFNMGVTPSYDCGRGFQSPGKGTAAPVPWSEMQCYECHGFGHATVDCPNGPDYVPSFARSRSSSKESSRPRSADRNRSSQSDRRQSYSSGSNRSQQQSQQGRSRSRERTLQTPVKDQKNYSDKDSQQERPRTGSPAPPNFPRPETPTGRSGSRSNSKESHPN